MTDLYHSTRESWEHIWDSASVEAELETLRFARSQEAIAAYLPYLPRDGVILEAGCGLSAVVIFLRAQGYSVVGLDYAVNALLKARAYDPALVLQAGDVHALPYADGSLGAYLSFGVLEHFEHGMGPALAEAARVLRPGGALVLTIPYPNVVHRLVRWRRRAQGHSALTDDGFYESVYTRRDLIEAAELAGFDVVETRPLSHAYTLWGLGGPFRAAGYYRTTPLADGLGRLLRVVAPWPFNFMTLLIGRRR